MEEAAQITEVETFIPLALQAPRDGELPLQRVVLCGDHFQNSPIVQNIAFRQYANLEQSLFARLVRLGVPTVNLDQQGRARPSIAQLYNWRYRELGNLPLLDQQPEYQTVNAGYVNYPILPPHRFGRGLNVSQIPSRISVHQCRGLQRPRRTRTHASFHPEPRRSGVCSRHVPIHASPWLPRRKDYNPHNVCGSKGSHQRCPQPSVCA